MVINTFESRPPLTLPVGLLSMQNLLLCEQKVIKIIKYGDILNL